VRSTPDRSMVTKPTLPSPGSVKRQDAGTGGKAVDR
jgi:hypothetical protein